MSGAVDAGEILLKGVRFRPRLNTPQNSRNSLARLVRLYAAGGIDSGSFRDLVYGLSKLLEYWRFEKDLELEEKLEAIEQAIRDRSGNAL